MKKEQIIKLLEKITESIYQKSQGECPLCYEKDYPVCGDKRGYDEVDPEDAEEWALDHADDCPVTMLDKLHVLLQEPSNNPKCKTCGGSGKGEKRYMAGHDMHPITHPCPHCKGTGKEPCETCGGSKEFIRIGEICPRCKDTGIEPEKQVKQNKWEQKCKNLRLRVEELEEDNRKNLEMAIRYKTQFSKKHVKQGLDPWHNVEDVNKIAQLQAQITELEAKNRWLEEAIEYCREYWGEVDDIHDCTGKNCIICNIERIKKESEETK